MEDQPASRGGADETEAARQERPQEPSGALGGEVEREPQSEEAVGRAHDAQVRGARREHLGLVAEEPQPRVREQGRGESDRLRGPGRDQGSGPGHPPGARALAGAEVGPDHRDQGGAEAEDQRDQEVLETHTHAVAREREGAEGPDQGREQDDGQVRHDVVDEARRADAQDLGEQAPLEAKRRREPDQASPGNEVHEEHERAGDVVRDHGEGGARDTQARKRPPAEDERGGEAHEKRAPAEHDAGR